VAPETRSVSAQLSAIERDGGDGTLELPGGGTLDVTSLDRKVFPVPGHTKGALMRYYVRVAPHLLPIVADRPLVLRRYPAGVDGKSFFQQNAPETVPAAVRVETIRSDDGEPQRRFVGGDLATLLYTVQLGAISVDPWNVRVGSLDRVDHAIIDLDPGAGSSFATAVAVARLIRQTLDELGREGCLKTSGKRGLHIQLPLDGGATEDEAVALAGEVAVRVAMARPDLATVERSVDARARGTVYVDYLQNIVAKTVAGAYSVRATGGATVSTPLAWKELTVRLDPASFPIANVPARIARVGERWCG
jgi:bifunctional non-homologous end joining protein LigD